MDTFAGYKISAPGGLWFAKTKSPRKKISTVLSAFKAAVDARGKEHGLAMVPTSMQDVDEMLDAESRSFELRLASELRFTIEACLPLETLEVAKGLCFFEGLPKYPSGIAQASTGLDTKHFVGMLSRSHLFLPKIKRQTCYLRPCPNCWQAPTSLHLPRKGLLMSHDFIRP